MNCSSCRYYRGTTIGYCHRFPPVTKAAATHWCGEFASVDVPKVEPISTKKGKSRLTFRPLPNPEND